MLWLPLTFLKILCYSQELYDHTHLQPHTLLRDARPSIKPFENLVGVLTGFIYNNLVMLGNFKFDI